jgi:hypothetical protein
MMRKGGLIPSAALSRNTAGNDTPPTVCAGANVVIDD